MKKFFFAALLTPCLITLAQDATTPAAPAPVAPAPDASGLVAPAKDPSVALLLIKPSPDHPMTFDQSELTVKPGQKVKLTFDNPVQPNLQGLPYNWVLVKPGKEAVVGSAALAMAVDPKAMQNHYIPAGADGGVHPDVIAHTKLVKPGSKTELEFTAPAEVGDFPYICSFPGHFRHMKGMLHVK